MRRLSISTRPPHMVKRHISIHLRLLQQQDEDPIFLHFFGYPHGRTKSSI